MGAKVSQEARVAEQDQALASEDETADESSPPVNRPKGNLEAHVHDYYTISFVTIVSPFHGV